MILLGLVHLMGGVKGKVTLLFATHVGLKKKKKKKKKIWVLYFVGWPCVGAS
jgi:hypothetical protein